MSQWRHSAITRHDLRIILICHQGYQSSLAAATLQQLGLIHATDLEGGGTGPVDVHVPTARALGALEVVCQEGRSGARRRRASRTGTPDGVLEPEGATGRRTCSELRGLG